MMSNIDQMPAEQALWAYSSMLYDSREQCESLRRELNIIINQFEEMASELKFWKRQAELLEAIFIGRGDAE